MAETEKVTQAETLTPQTDKEKFEATKKALNNLLVAWRGGGDLGPALKEAQDFLDNVDKEPEAAAPAESEAKAAEEAAA